MTTLPTAAEARSGAPVSAPAESGEEVRLVGLSPRGQAASAALLGLARAARSFTLYDPKNEAVRALISDYREKVRRALDSFGALELELRPFEIALGNEVVYQEKDRERSLSFRLFRDGVRRLTLLPEATWDDCVRLLEILSIRYVGVRQQEDDLVTLLRKASFEGIRFEAVEGFVPDEENPEPPLDDLAAQARNRHPPPPDFDTPLPPFEKMGTVQLRPLSPEIEQRLRAEEAPEALPLNTVRVVQELLRHQIAQKDGILALAAEIRDYLVVEGRSDALLELGRTLLASMGTDPAEGRAVLEACLGRDALRVIIRAQPDGASTIPGGLDGLLLLDPAENLRALAELLPEELGGPHEALVRSLLALAGRGAPDLLAELTHRSDKQARLLLVDALREVKPESSVEAAVELCAEGDTASQERMLQMLAQMEFTSQTAALAKQLLESPAESIRRATVELLTTRGGQRGYPVLHAFLERRAAELSRSELEQAGRAMSRISPRAALQTFSVWTNAASKGLFGKLVGSRSHRPLLWAAVAGLEPITGPAGLEADALLKRIAQRGDAELRRYCDEVRSRREARGLGGSRGQ